MLKFLSKLRSKLRNSAAMAGSLFAAVFGSVQHKNIGLRTVVFLFSTIIEDIQLILYV